MPRRGTHHQGLCPSGELHSQLDFWRGSAGNEETLVHQAPHDAQRVVETPLRLFQHQLVAASQQHRGRATLIVDARHPHDLALANLHAAGTLIGERLGPRFVPKNSFPLATHVRRINLRRLDTGERRVVWSLGLACGRGRTVSLSTRSALPSFSGRMWSTCETGRQSSVLLMNSISSRSMSRTTMIFAFACTASLRGVSCQAPHASQVQRNPGGGLRGAPDSGGRGP